MGLASFLFGGSKAADKAMDLASSSIKGVGNWIDNRTFTDQEKSVANADAVKLHLKLVELTANENSTRSITRRIMAWAVVGVILALGIISVGFALAGQGEAVKSVLLVAEAFKLGWAFTAVIVFYFGIPFVRK